MGAYWLHSFAVEKKLIKPVSYQKKILDCYNQQNKKPLIVIDLNGLQSLWLPSQERLCGTRAPNYKERAKKFFNSLVEAGAELVFFTDGPMLETKADEMCIRKNKEYANSIQVLDKLQAGMPLSSICSKPVKNDKHCIPLLKSAAAEFGPVYSSWDTECDQVAAAYATQNDALAVIASDTDFLIYEGNWSVWNSNSINVFTGTTMEYDRIEIRNALGLEVAQMPLFSCLAGNDYVNRNSLTNFHKHFGQTCSERFLNIANFVKKFPKTLTDDNIEKISTIVWGKKDNTQLENLKTGIKVYDINQIDDKIEEQDPLIRFLIDKNCRRVVSALKNTPEFIVCYYQDMRAENSSKNYVSFQTLSQVVLGISQRLRGFINNGSSEKTFKCLIKRNHDTGYKIIDVEYEFPPKTLASLTFKDLLVEFTDMDDNNNCASNLKNWQILRWIFLESFEYENFVDCDQKYVPVLATLAFMVKKWELTPDEADVILMSFRNVYNSRVASELMCPTHLNLRAVKIAFAFMQILHQVHEIMASLGLDPFPAFEFFDGVYFHLLYQSWLEARKDNEHVSVSNFIQKMRSIYMVDKFSL